MAFPVINSVSNSVSKSLAVVDDVVDTAALAAGILKLSMTTAHTEAVIESIESTNNLLLKAASLTPAQQAYVKSLQLA